MDWAAEHEIPDAQKAAHATVKYEDPSKIPSRHCGVCRNVIVQAGEPTRCRTVKSPIGLGDWCVRFVPEEKQDEEAA